MPSDPPAVRILPMSDRTEGFAGRSIADVQRAVFLRDLATNGGRFRYRKAGLNARAGTVVLFQFQGRVIASGVFVLDEKFAAPQGPHAGALLFEPESMRVFAPVDADGMRRAWPGFRRFGHAKQSLNPAGYADFRRRLRDAGVARSKKRPPREEAIATNGLRLIGLGPRPDMATESGHAG